MTISRIEKCLINNLNYDRKQIVEKTEYMCKQILNDQAEVILCKEDVKIIDSIIKYIENKNMVNEDTRPCRFTAPGKFLTLANTIDLFLKSKNGEPQTISQITDGVIALGYKSKAKRMEYPVQAILNRSKRFHSIYDHQGRTCWVLEEVYQTKYKNIN